MHGRFACALLFGVVGVLAANAADLSGQNVSGGYAGYSPFGARIEPVLIYDFEPGVIVRSYWYAPWNNRHYFPKTGRRPKVGRRENISSHRVGGSRDYYRFWSVSSVFLSEVPNSYARPYIRPVPPATDR